MNVTENYDGNLERTNTHPMLLQQKMETLQDETIKILKKSGVTSVSHKKKITNPAKVLANKRVIWKEPLPRRRSVLSDGRIAQVSITQVKKNRARRALRSGSGKLSGGITRMMCRLNSSSEAVPRQYP